MRIILASQSPRRRELLKNIGIDFEVMVDNSDEVIIAQELPKDSVLRLSLQKAKNVAERCNNDSLVIAADTVVSIDDKILGKPKDEQEAKAMLRTLSGRSNTVYTGVTVIRTSDRKTVCDYVATDVKFRVMADSVIAGYVNSGEPMDKAGAYGIQELGALLIEGVSGDYFNVVGLPLCRLGEILTDEFGLKLL